MLNWTPYDHHDWAKCKQAHFRPAEKNKIEWLAATILRLRDGEDQGCWGTVYPPGRNALVIKIHPSVLHGRECAGNHCSASAEMSFSRG